MKLWLDDVRDPDEHRYNVEHRLEGFVWVTSYDEAIEVLKTGKVVYASLDHDLGLLSCKECRQSAGSYEKWSEIQDHGCIHGEKTGYNVICWMEENNVWPREGVRVHSANPAGKDRMLQVIRKIYGRDFQ